MILPQNSKQRPFTAKSFYEYINEKKLMGARCKACNMLFLPPRAVCSQCYNADMEWQELDGKGKLIAFSIMYSPSPVSLPSSPNQSYCTGIVELQSGVKISAHILGLNLSDPSLIQLNIPVRLCFIEGQENNLSKVHLAFIKDE